VAVEEGNATLRLQGHLKDPFDVCGLEGDISVNLALSFAGEDDLVYQRGEPSPAAARSPERETEILLAVGANEVMNERIVNSLGHRDRVGHGIVRNRFSMWTR